MNYWNTEKGQHERYFESIKVPKWKWWIVEYLCRILNVSWTPGLPFIRNAKGKSYNLVNGKLISKK